MRAWLYDLLTQDNDLQTLMGYTAQEMLQQVIPRESAETVNRRKPYLVYGLGNATNEDIAEDIDYEAYRQFFQIWIHDEGGSYLLIDQIVHRLRKLLVGQTDPGSKVSAVRWLENSQEFSNQTYNTIFRYARFQAIISEGAPIS